MTQTTPVTAPDAAAAIAGMTWTRLRRSPSLWIALALSMVPAAIGLASSSFEAAEGIATALICIVPTLLGSGLIADEITEHTAAYLWPRPIHRSAIYAGKLLAVVPIAALFAGISMTAAGLVTGVEFAGVALGYAAASAIACAVACALGTLVPRRPMVVAVLYFVVFDFPAGSTPFGLANLTLSHNAHQMGEGHPADAIAWLTLLFAVWLVIGLWRTARMQPGAR